MNCVILRHVILVFCCSVSRYTGSRCPASRSSAWHCYVSRCSAPHCIGSRCSAIRVSFLLLICITCFCITLLCHTMFCTTWFFSWRTPKSRIYWALKAGSKPSPPLPEDEEAWATWLNAKWNRESASTNKTAALTYPGKSCSVQNMLKQVRLLLF